MSSAAMAIATVLAIGWSPVLRNRAREDVHDDPNLYAAAVETEVTYDDMVAARYDDGYGPAVSAPFEAELAPFGTWITDPKLGRVWVPSLQIVGRDFSPYATNGTWVLTEYGWTWDSKWTWGWAPFHYGRWAMRDGRQWCWVPGTLWAPAWVAWRASRSFVGWAPLPPRGMRLARPVGKHSPWQFTSAKSLGLGPGERVSPERSVLAFIRTGVVSRTRWMRETTLAVQVPAGPDPARCCGTPVRPVALAIGAPGATPRLPIKARRGAPLETRPWMVAGAREQPETQGPSAPPSAEQIGKGPGTDASQSGGVKRPGGPPAQLNKG